MPGPRWRGSCRSAAPSRMRGGGHGPGVRTRMGVRCLPLGGGPLLEAVSGHDTAKAVHLRVSGKVHGFGGAEMLERWDVSDPHGPSVPAVLKWSANRLGDPVTGAGLGRLGSLGLLAAGELGEHTPEGRQVLVRLVRQRILATSDDPVHLADR